MRTSDENNRTLCLRGLVDLEYLRTRGDRWGFFHELGHNHQLGDRTFSGSGEVTVS